MGAFVLEDFLPYQLAVLADQVSRSFSDVYREKFGLSISEWRVVAHLMQDENISIREIYKRVGMDKSKASRASARLERAGYVRKRPNASDGRLIDLSLTKKGRQMADEIGPLGLAFETQVLAALSETDKEHFLTAIRTLLEHGKLEHEK